MKVEIVVITFLRCSLRCRLFVVLVSSLRDGMLHADILYIIYISYPILLWATF